MHHFFDHEGFKPGTARVEGGGKACRPATKNNRIEEVCHLVLLIILQNSRIILTHRAGKLKALLPT